MTQYYTKTGDKGETGVVSGRSKKTDPRFSAIGIIDEVNAAIGVALSFVDDGGSRQLLIDVQNKLFTVGAELAGTAHVKIVAEDTIEMEKKIDEIATKIKPQTSFLLPSGTKAASFLHHARAIARRAERTLWRLHEIESLNEETLKYVNRLSSLLFVLARYENKNIEEQAPKY